MRISLVVATVGRTSQLIRLFDSLADQQFYDFEVIVVDQNDDDGLVQIINKYSRLFLIKHVRCKPGLSYARNIGIDQVTGDIVSFPDDDCWYDSSVLTDVHRFFSANNCVDGLTGICMDESGRQSAGIFDYEYGDVTTENVWRRAVSTTIFLRRIVLEKYGGFDLQLGLGSSSRWQSAEESDLILRLIKNNCTIIFNPLFVVRHPQTVFQNYGEIKKRAVSYARGFIYVCVKHNTPKYRIGVYLIRPLIGSIFYLITFDINKCRFSFWTFCGRLTEYLRLNLS